MFAYTPFPIGLDAHGLGLVFFGWGIGVAVTSVFVAPRLRDRSGTLRTTLVVLASIAILMVIGASSTSKPTLIAVVVASGLSLGVNNALITQGVMKVAIVPRPIASAGYSFVRFIGGAIAPYLAARLGEIFNPHVPFFVGAATMFSRSSCCSPAVDTLAASTPKRVMFFRWVRMSQHHSAHNLPPRAP